MSGGAEAKAALVTGAASGIGAATVAELSRRGWTVAGLDLRPAENCEYSVTADTSDTNAVLDGIQAVESRLGPISCAVSVAGYYEMVAASQITTEQWYRMLRVHLGGLVNLTRAVLPGMVARGSGSVIAVSSELAVGGGSGDAHYAAAKGAILGMVRSLAAEVAAAGVRVNAVAPGPTDTPLLPSDSPWRAPDYLSTLPLHRLVKADEVALCIGFLASDASFCVGEVLNPNAGAVI